MALSVLGERLMINHRLPSITLYSFAEGLNILYSQRIKYICLRPEKRDLNPNFVIPAPH
jgi:hypothetical protein